MVIGCCIFLTFALVGNGTGKILKGAGQGVGHAFGGCKYTVDQFAAFISRSHFFQWLVVRYRLEKALEKASQKATGELS